VKNPFSFVGQDDHKYYYNDGDEPEDLDNYNEKGYYNARSPNKIPGTPCQKSIQEFNFNGHEGMGDDLTPMQVESRLDPKIQDGGLDISDSGKGVKIDYDRFESPDPIELSITKRNIAPRE
jgi:hypothetical protein